jgi:hypothetical protein
VIISFLNHARLKKDSISSVLHKTGKRTHAQV